VTVELERKFVPLMVRVCAAAPTVVEEGERLVILGTGFDGGGGEELPPPPPQDTEIARTSASRKPENKWAQMRACESAGLALTGMGT
jgi:hypothetical protein